MDFLEEPTAQSFIVKVWVEEPAGQSGRGIWHGHITHVHTGKRRYMKSLDEIEDFIAPHLEEMGARLGMRWRLRHWLKRMVKRR